MKKRSEISFPIISFKKKYSDNLINIQRRLERIVGSHIRSENQFKCKLCDFTNTETGELNEHFLNHHAESDNETPVKEIASYYEEIKNLACNKCDFTDRTLKAMKKHVRKFHIKHEAEESDEWLRFKSSPFRFDGILHRGTAKVNLKSLELENEELKRKNEALEKENKAFQAELSTPHIKIV